MEGRIGGEIREKREKIKGEKKEHGEKSEEKRRKNY